MKISIITINRNTGASVDRTIASVRSQDYPTIEWVIVDGCSSDNSGAALRLACKDGDSYRSEPDRGIANAFNKGVARATGSAVIFMNAGDAFESERSLSDLVMNWDRSRYRWITGGGRVLDEALHECFSRLPDKDPINLINRYCRVFHAATLIDRTLFEQCGAFDESYKIAMDYDFWTRIMSRGYDPQILGRIVARFYIGGTSSRLIRRTLEERRSRRSHGMRTSCLREALTMSTVVLKASCPQFMRNRMLYRMKEWLRV